MLAYLLVYAYEETGAREAVLAHAGQRGEKTASSASTPISAS